MITVNQDKLKAIKLADCKTQARALLIDSDWAELPSVLETLENASEWKEYRVAVRTLLISPVENPNFPNTPKVVWKNA